MSCDSDPSFRVGRKLGRTVYMKPRGVDTVEAFVGIFDQPEMARFACAAMNKVVSEGLFDPPEPGDGTWQLIR